ncbi:SAM-dependent methyltransferase-like protein [Oscillochloris trichoides DG-6]|uniref:SAM-dependent methyltransferase-like protein n=1 Tax=Oscillochloris trichoides DG-6 TaxID=765420 RepID=E1IG12_9CHLR|nr:class I SAM-dependent methyltransferase [Oscillochloris trichoides]EFO79901.1 SAM-dependent methyltransferase-like protein [Oscillochloris trichoides DG-6]
MVSLTERLDLALAARADLIDAPHQSAWRLFTGFVEGCPELVLDIYATTAVLHNYADPPELGAALLAEALAWLRERVPWVSAVVVKVRHAASAEEQAGRLVWGERAARRVREHGVWYAVDLTMNRDASFYLDTRNLRGWLQRELHGQSLLNTFAYTGSLGVAALAGGARRVVQLDLNRRFLNLAKDSYSLNGLPVQRADFLSGDFWTLVNRLKRAGEQFDCVILDPPIFSATGRGVVDLAGNYIRLINKVRPLIRSGGRLVAINNAIFLSGQEYLEMLHTICQDRYVRILEYIDVAHDCAGYPTTRINPPLRDPAPFNHATKIAILEITHKV